MLARVKLVPARAYVCPLGKGLEQLLRDAPAVDPVRRARDREVRDASQVLDPGEERIKVMGFPPLGIQTLAPVLRQRGHRVRLRARPPGVGSEDEVRREQGAEVHRPDGRRVQGARQPSPAEDPEAEERRLEEEGEQALDGERGAVQVRVGHAIAPARVRGQLLDGLLLLALVEEDPAGFGDFHRALLLALGHHLLEQPQPFPGQ